MRKSLGILGVVVIVVGLGIYFLVKLPGNSVANAALPVAEAKVLDDLRDDISMKLASRSDMSVNSHWMTLDEKAVAKLLDNAKASPENFDILAETLFAAFAAHADAYKPGKALSEELLRKEKFYIEDNPAYGLDVYAYLLIELAKYKNSPAFYRQTFQAIQGAAKSQAYFEESLSAYKHPELIVEFERTKAINGGTVTTLGTELAYWCERFMVDEYLAEDKQLPEAAQKVIADYWNWRKGIFEAGRVEPVSTSLYGDLDNQLKTDALGHLQQFKTMEYFEQLTEAL